MLQNKLSWLVAVTLLLAGAPAKADPWQAFSDCQLLSIRLVAISQFCEPAKAGLLAQAQSLQDSIVEKIAKTDPAKADQLRQRAVRPQRLRYNCPVPLEHLPKDPAEAEAHQAKLAETVQLRVNAFLMSITKDGSLDPTAVSSAKICAHARAEVAANTALGTELKRTGLPFE